MPGPGIQSRGEPSWTVRAVRYATRVTPKSAVFYDYAAFGEPDVPFRTDYFFWLLSRPGETIVVDVGFGARTAARMASRAPARARTGAA